MSQKVTYFENGPRFRVQSATREEITHLCAFDELEKYPHGRCSCEAFHMRIGPAIDRGETPPSTQCSHLRACVEWMEEEIKRRKGQ